MQPTRRLRYEPLEARMLLAADFNGDGFTDGADYTIWRNHFGLTGGPTEAPFAPGDANGDGNVDQADYEAWRTDFGTADLPGLFSILEPSGFIDTATPTVTWEASEFATGYLVDIALDANCTNSVLVVDNVIGESQAVGPLAEGEYHVCVSAQNAAGSRESSNSGLSFTYDVTPPGTFDITTPAAGAELITTPTLQWTESIDAAEYTVEVAAVSDPATPLQTATVPDTSLALDPLAPGDYLVSVTAFDAAGNQQPADNDGLSFSIVAAPEPLTMFVTSGLYVNNGDTSVFPPSNPFFGSLSAADFYVTSAAASAGLITDWDGITPLYRAVLSDNSVDARDRVPTDRAIVNVLGETVADSAMDLFSGNLHRPVNVDQFGNTVTSTLSAWTGSASNGTQVENCGDWLNPSLSATVGDVNATDTQWISSGLQTCFSQARFYAAGPFEPEPSDLPRAVFDPRAQRLHRHSHADRHLGGLGVRDELRSRHRARR